MARHSNAFVDYLNRFTTVSPEHEAAFDEFVEEVDPPDERLRLNTKTETFFQRLFKVAIPPSVILTGNVGDGKTYLCRKMIETFAGGFDRWPTDENEWKITRSDGHKLHIVKDLSETDEESALYGSPTLENIEWRSAAYPFAVRLTKLLIRLDIQRDDDEPELIILLRELKSHVGQNRVRRVDEFINALDTVVF